MTTITSTVPGAIATLLGHFRDVASANRSLDLGVYSGIPVADVKNNYLAVGQWETGQLISGYHQDWAGLPASAAPKIEDYSILCTIRTWAGTVDQLGRLNDAFTLLDGVMSALKADPGASGTITPSGTWQVTSVEIPVAGALGGKGYGVLMSFDVPVINVRITS